MVLSIQEHFVLTKLSRKTERPQNLQANHLYQYFIVSALAPSNSSSDSSTKLMPSQLRLIKEAERMAKASKGYDNVEIGTISSEKK
ncbi:hypothetical protein DICVIV_03481 [Dictyocaulus viviparus]|uniref:Uncharacterized protein n=1 Tax=Dictyocaulus viviparus TaxID=29172 RepID=A0A0D8Y0G4_DICVI|nr:hypothetical protein DICVIV_03481 [Dictyocaulus viviparus]